MGYVIPFECPDCGARLSVARRVAEGDTIADCPECEFVETFD